MASSSKYWVVKHDAKDDLYIDVSGTKLITRDMYNLDGSLNLEVIESCDGSKFYTDNTNFPDFVNISRLYLCINSNIFKLLISNFEFEYSTIKIYICDIEYTILFPTTQLDIFNKERSEFEYFSGSTSRIKVVRKLAINYPKSSFDLFRLHGDWTLVMIIMCSDKFRDLYERNSLTGLVFKDVRLVN